MSNYIPRNDAEFVNFLTNVLTVLNAGNLTATGLTAPDVAPLTAANTTFDTAVTDKIAKEQAFRAAVGVKDTRRDAVEAILRTLVNRIQVAPGVTDGLRLQLDIPVRGADAGGGSDTPRTEVPSVVLETVPGQVIVHWGTNAANEQRNSKPRWARGANIYRKKTGETQYVLVGFDTASPFVDKVPGAAVTATYKVAYRGTREDDESPFSPEQSVAAGG